MRGKRALIASCVLIGLTFFTTSASAECAWVLWKAQSKFERGDVNLTIEPANPVGAFTASGECDRVAHDQAEAYRLLMRTLASIKKAEVSRLDYGGWRVVLQGENEVRSTDYQCFPDTVDPRG